jgi:hypothetical protein
LKRRAPTPLDTPRTRSLTCAAADARLPDISEPVRVCRPKS